MLHAWASQRQNSLGAPSPLRAPASTPRANRGTAWQQAHVGRVHLAYSGKQRRLHSPGAPSLPRPCWKPSEKGRRQPYVQKQALIREEALPALQARLLRLEVHSH